MAKVVNDEEKLLAIQELCNNYRKPEHTTSFFNRFIYEIENIIENGTKEK